MQRVCVWFAAGAALVFVSSGPSQAEESASLPAHQYVGAAKCKSCHKKELMGNQHAKWMKGPHAKAYETLKGDKAAEVAKEKGIATPPYETKECLGCHTTAYGLPAAAFKKKPLKAQDGVQCESCHGPGSNYRKKSIMSDEKKSIANGLVLPTEEVCTACHNDESPTWDPAVGFDFEEAKKKDLFKQLCPKYVISAAEILDEML